MTTQEKVFSKAFETAELAKLNATERTSCEDSLKYYRDVKNSLDTVKDEGIVIGKELGREEGLLEGKIEGIKRALNKEKLSIDEIAELFDVSVEFIIQIKNREV